MLNTSRSSEGQGHDATCCCLSNIVCEYVVNPLTHDNPKLLTQTNKVVKEQFQMSRSSEGPGQNASCL